MRLIPFAAAFLTTVALLTACNNERDSDDCTTESLGGAPTVAVLAFPERTSGGTGGRGGSSGGRSSGSKRGEASKPKPAKQKPAKPSTKNSTSGGHSSHHNDDCEDD
ncbi:hypothetical protein OG292_19690 [Streptomyces sp. NBC_01511]|uniref:hypothetical protein n=1 Tax=Streptomyces sp. NBC_01511 TaxID=2903889 RepID=UPI00386F1BEC